MATIKQKLAIEKIMENHGNVSRAMLEVGYEPATAKNPKNLTESKGFKEICDDIGLTDEFISQAIYDDIKAKPGDRAKELALGVKIKGLEKTTIDIQSKGESINPNPELATKFSAFLKAETKE